MPDNTNPWAELVADEAAGRRNADALTKAEFNVEQSSSWANDWALIDIARSLRTIAGLLAPSVEYHNPEDAR